MVDGEGTGEGTGGEGNGGEGNGGEGNGGEGAGGEGAGGQQVEAREWMNTLPDELKADATLARFADVPSLAKAHIEAHKLAKSKFTVPGEGATPEDWGKVWDALGRPADFNEYDIPVGELPVDATDEQRTAVAEAVKPYKEFAHKIGLTPHQATAVAQFDLDRAAASTEKGKEEVAALQTKLGKDFDPKVDQAKQVYQKIFGTGVDAAILANELDRLTGSGRLLQGMMRLAEIASEHSIIQSDKVEGLGEVKDASAKIDELMDDKTWREKYNAGDAATTAQYNKLLALAKDQALRGRARA